MFYLSLEKSPIIVSCYHSVHQLLPDGFGCSLFSLDAPNTGHLHFIGRMNYPTSSSGILFIAHIADGTISLGGYLA